MQTITELFNNVYAAGSPTNTSASGQSLAVAPASEGLSASSYQPIAIAPIGFTGENIASIGDIFGPEIKLNNETSLASPFRNTANVKVIA